MIRKCGVLPHSSRLVVTKADVSRRGQTGNPIMDTHLRFDATPHRTLCRGRRLGVLLALLGVILIPATRVAAQGSNDTLLDENDFADMDLSELMNIDVVEVTSLAGVEQKLLTTPAAMSVITSLK